MDLKAVYNAFDDSVGILPDANSHLSARTLLCLYRSSRNAELFEEEVSKRLRNDTGLSDYLKENDPNTVASHMKGIYQI